MNANFSDNFTHKLDLKNRVSIPSSYRQCSENDQCEFVISKGLDSCLEVRPAPVWDEFIQTLTEKLRMTNSKHRAYVRSYTQDASRVKCDKQGRILLPQKLLDFANIKESVKIIGVGSIFEIWDAATFENYEFSHLSPDDSDFADIEELLQ